jgi:SPP1 gp7 family putative phage head morphogenesis protein
MDQHNHEKKQKARKAYNNIESYDDELDIIYSLLRHTKKIEKEITQEFQKVLEELCELYKEAFPFYYKNGVLNKNEFQKLLLTLITSGGLKSDIQEALDRMTHKVDQLQRNRLMAWLILDYELTAQKTAKSVGLDYAKYNEFITQQHKEEIVKQSWCKDGKTFLDRIEDNTRTMSVQLRLAILEGVKKGWTLEQMSEYFRKITGMAANKAARLIRTETMAVYSKVTKEIFLERGIEYIEIIGDAICGGICLDYVGEAVPLRDAAVGIDLPPYHPNCACSFCSYTEFEDIDIRDFVEIYD